jgi:hypothetical protein
MALQKVGEINLKELGGTVIDIRSDIKTVGLKIKRFEQGIPRAFRNAMNGSATKARQATGPLLGAKFNTKPSHWNKTLTVQPRASNKRLTVAVRGRGRRMNIYKTAKGSKKQGPLGVSFNSGGGRKTHPHTFLAKVGNGTIGIFVRRRKGSRRVNKTNDTTGKGYTSELPIRMLRYPSVANAILNKDIRPKIQGAYVKAMDDLYIDKLIDQYNKAVSI